MRVGGPLRIEPGTPLLSTDPPGLTESVYLKTLKQSLGTACAYVRQQKEFESKCQKTI